jgi:tol-pal system protein YbgF
VGVTGPSESGGQGEVALQVRQLILRRIIPVSLLLLVGAGSAYPQKKEIIQLQRDMAILQEVVRQTERQMGERIAVLENLLQQSLDKTDKLNAAIAVLERNIAKQTTDVSTPVSATASRVETLQGQVGALREVMEEIRTRLGRVEQQVGDIKTQVTTLPPPSFGSEPGAGAEGSAATGATSAETLFNSAFADYTRGNYDLAREQFDQYLRLYSNTVRAPEAQYYIGAIAYQNSQYDEALRHFDMVLERYPVGVISADAQFKKGMALLKLERPQDAGREFQAVIDRYPNSNVAPAAQGQIDQLQGAGKPSPLRRAQ